LYVKATKQKAESEIPADIPQTEINGAEPAPVVSAGTEIPEPADAIPAPVEPAPDVEAVAKAEQAAAEADIASFALKKQIDDMRRAGQLQRERLEYQRVQIHNAPQTREQKLEAWKPSLSEQEFRFLSENPRMVDHHELTTWAAQQAIAAGHERNSSDYWRSIEQTFDREMNRMKARTEAQEPTPKFFQPPPAPAPRKASTASIVSAPVSRGVPSSEPKPLSADRMATRLSLEEQQIAAASGISLTEYAKNKLRLEREKREGTRQ
jgi:hypothetical protein